MTIDDDRARVLMTMVAIMDLSGNSNKKMSAKTPRNTPTLIEG
jgi:hypothetical protein